MIILGQEALKGRDQTREREAENEPYRLRRAILAVFCSTFLS